MQETDMRTPDQTQLNGSAHTPSPSPPNRLRAFLQHPLVRPLLGGCLLAAFLLINQFLAKRLLTNHILPQASKAVSKVLDRKVELGPATDLNVFTGLTLGRTAVGPSKDEFSCGETAKVRITLNLLSSILRRQIVLEALVEEPQVLVAQQPDFTWLGLPQPLDKKPEVAVKGTGDSRAAQIKRSRAEKKVQQDAEREARAIVMAQKQLAVLLGAAHEGEGKEADGARKAWWSRGKRARKESAKNVRERVEAQSARGYLINRGVLKREEDEAVKAEEQELDSEEAQSGKDEEERQGVLIDMGAGIMLVEDEKERSVEQKQLERAIRRRVAEQTRVDYAAAEESIGIGSTQLGSPEQDAVLESDSLPPKIDGEAYLALGEGQEEIESTQLGGVVFESESLLPESDGESVSDKAVRKQEEDLPLIEALLEGKYEIEEAPFGQLLQDDTDIEETQGERIKTSEGPMLGDSPEPLVTELSREEESGVEGGQVPLELLQELEGRGEPTYDIDASGETSPLEAAASGTDTSETGNPQDTEATKVTDASEAPAVGTSAAKSEAGDDEAVIPLKQQLIAAIQRKLAAEKAEQAAKSRRKQKGDGAQTAREATEEGVSNRRESGTGAESRKDLEDDADLLAERRASGLAASTSSGSAGGTGRREAKKSKSTAVATSATREALESRASSEGDRASTTVPVESEKGEALEREGEETEADYCEIGGAKPEAGKKKPEVKKKRAIAVLDKVVIKKGTLMLLPFGDHAVRWEPCFL
jgi:hypothetical protein